MSASLDIEIRVADIEGLSNSEAIALGRSQQQALIAELEALAPEDWDKPTDCDRWSVHDIVAHILGWAEAFTSPGEFVRLSRATRRLRKELDVKLDAQNEAQVLARRDMTPEQLILGLKTTGDKFLTVRKNLGFVGRALPFYHPVIGASTVGFLMGQIYTRDHFMHRVDIARATGRDLALGEPERRIVADIARHWARSSKADARLVLTGPAGGTFIAGTGERATITIDAVEFCRLLAGRAGLSVAHIEGDETSAWRWLAARVPF